LACAAGCGNLLGIGDLGVANPNGVDAAQPDGGAPGDASGVENDQRSVEVSLDAGEAPDQSGIGAVTVTDFNAGFPRGSVFGAFNLASQVPCTYSTYPVADAGSCRYTACSSLPAPANLSAGMLTITGGLPDPLVVPMADAGGAYSYQTNQSIFGGADTIGASWSGAEVPSGSASVTAPPGYLFMTMPEAGTSVSIVPTTDLPVSWTGPAAVGTKARFTLQDVGMLRLLQCDFDLTASAAVLPAAALENFGGNATLSLVATTEATVSVAGWTFALDVQLNANQSATVNFLCSGVGAACDDAQSCCSGLVCVAAGACAMPP